MPGNSLVSISDRPDMTSGVHRVHKATNQSNKKNDRPDYIKNQFHVLQKHQTTHLA